MQKEFNKIKYYTVEIPLKTGTRVYNIDTNSPLNGAYVEAVYTRRNTASARSLLGKTLANDANFDAAFLILKKSTQTKVVEAPLSLVEKATNVAPECGFEVFAFDLNWNACQVEIAEGVTIDDGKVLELTFRYYELKK